ncbi:hypothetical protein [Lacticaseibacillus saniviri]|uniref:hypothetical protein n=1 Tax=Lacticaseibacillus saniviri TaxID=931533 RepID=UPI00070521A0|nr:hypothetical protein [Lacticaseibacillus saniviri]
MKGLIEYIWEAPAIWIIGVIVAVVTLNLIIFIYLSGTFDKADREIQRKQAQIEREFEERAKKSKDWLNFKTKDKKKD